jgi:hypothetical protein
MGAEQLQVFINRADPPAEAVQAAAIRDFMVAYHLTDSRDAIRQYSVLRRAQAEQLKLTVEERERFLGWLPTETE